MAVATGHVGYTLQRGEKASRQHRGIRGAWANPWPSYSWTASVELGPRHSLVHGSHPSRTRVGVGRGPAVAPGDGVDHGEVGSPPAGTCPCLLSPLELGWGGGTGPTAHPHYSSCAGGRLLQIPVQAAARMASTRGVSASVTPSVCTTRAAAATTPPSAKPKVLVLQPPSQLGQGLPGWPWVPDTAGARRGPCWVRSAPTCVHRARIWCSGCCSTRDFWQLARCCLRHGVHANPYCLGASGSCTQTL